MDNSYSWEQLFTHSFSPFYGYVTSFSAAKEIIKQFENATNSSYVVRSVKRQGIGNESGSSIGNNHCIRFEDIKKQNSKLPYRIECDNVPFICKNIETFVCHRGKKYEKSSDAKALDHDYDKVRKKNIQNSKKQGCEACIVVREIVRFPGFKIIKNTQALRRRASQQLKASLSEISGNVETENRYYVYLPKLSDHNHDNNITEDYVQELDKKLKDKIYQLVAEGIDNTIEIKRYLKEFVSSNKAVWFKNSKFPSEHNKRFYPSNHTIRNHVNLALNQYRYSKVDQENLDSMLKDWEADGSEIQYLFRPYIVNGTEEMQSLLFVYQSKNQKHLLQRYGNEACLLDATYKTSKYALPVFFIAVKTNVDYQPIAIFIVMNETIYAIAEALNIIKSWNPHWSPKYFMTDFSEAEIKAIEDVFVSTETFLCDFHKEQSWDRWLSNKDHGVYMEKKKILEMFRKISHAENKIDFENALLELENSDVWKKSLKLQEYFKKTWEPVMKKWVWFFRSSEFIVNIKTNNGIESLNGELKNCYLSKHKDKSLSGVIKVICKEFFVEKFQKYIEKNISCLSTVRNYAKEVPAYLHNRPRNFVAHCITRIESSTHIKTVTWVEDFKFLVESEECKNKFYNVVLGNTLGFPSCECFDWLKYRWPCKHMFAILKHTQNNWDNIGMKYINSVFHILDETIVPSTYQSMTGKIVCQSVTDETCQSVTDETCQSVIGGTACQSLTGDAHLELEIGASTSLHSSENIAVKNLSRSAAECRILLKELTNLTYKLNDEIVADELNKNLQELLVSTSLKISGENELPLEITKSNTPKCKKFSSELPKKKKRKVMYTKN